MMNYPGDCIQYLTDGVWWEKKNVVQRGSLLLAIVPYFDSQPARLVPTSRPIPTSHGEATIAFEKFTIDTPQPRTTLPIAALTTASEQEMLLAFLGKARPVIVLADNESMSSGTGQQKKSTFLVAPYYGVRETRHGRAGFPRAFLDEVKKGDYPQYLWDLLPIAKDDSGSLLRFDRIFCVAKSQEGRKGYYKPLGYCLSEDAYKIYLQWLMWSLDKRLSEASLLYDLIDCVRNC